MAYMTNFSGIFLALLLLYFAHVTGRNVVIGLLGEFTSNKHGQALGLFQNDDDTSYESSNSMLDGSYDFSRALQAVKQKFQQIGGLPKVTFTFRPIPFSSDASLNHVINLLYENKDACDAFVFGFSGENAATAFYKSHELLCNSVDALVTELNIPTFTWSCLYNPESFQHSTMLGALPDARSIGRSVTSFMRHQKWRKVAFLTSSFPDAWRAVCNEVEHELMASNHFVIQYYERFTRDFFLSSKGNSRAERLATLWRKLQQAQVSAVVICAPLDQHNQHQTSEGVGESFLTELLASAYSVDADAARSRAFVLVDWKGFQHGSDISQSFGGKIVSKSRRSAVVDHEEVYFASIKLNLTQNGVQKEDSDNGFGRGRIAKRSVGSDFEGQMYENVLVVSPSLPEQSLELLESTNSSKCDYLYFLDSVLLGMVAMSAAPGKKQLIDGRSVVDRVSQTTRWNGFTGPVLFDEDKRRKVNFTVWDLLPERGLDAVQVMTIDTAHNGTAFKVTEVAQITWSSQGQPLSDTCEKLPFLCQVSSIGINTQDIVVAIFLGTGLYIVVYGTYIFLRKKKEWTTLLRGPSKLFLTDADLKFLTQSNTARPCGEMTSRDVSTSRVGSLVTLVDHNLISAENNVAMIKGDYVFLKKVTSPPTEIKNPARDVLKQLKELRHENVCLFHGLYSNAEFHFMVIEFTHRRSLKELIENQDCELNFTFKVSLLHDLVRGMKYIHASPIQCHGRLKSRNCVVDGRFVLKVTDYGVNRLRSVMGVTPDLDCNPKDLLWTSPELLNDPTSRQIGSQKGDCYSFAIICQELILRSDPFSMTNLSAEEIIEKLKNPPPLLRPSVSNEAAPIEIIQIMKQCWQEQPELRLTFSAIHTEIKRMNRGKKHNIVEDMMKQLEDYSSHLEDLVNERTAELKEEKKKTEQLLMRMLPPSVAKLLMSHQKIIPESFEKCTIYFSDICGFTTISLASTPMQVVDFLNDLYTCFDAIIEKYELYKVETIGDAYMVSSGIPKVIGDRHAEEAACMALDIMSATTTFRIPHLPDVDLRIRIGMHSGPAVAGVVGLMMPRYCLFGDTINTASRLETTGIPSRIHISADTKKALDMSPKKFDLQKRGTIELKGRGEMETWWLIGMEGFDKPLPNPGDVNGPSHGIKIDKSRNVNQSSNIHEKTNHRIEVPTKRVSTDASNYRHRHNRKGSGGSSYVIATPLALIPEVTSDPKFGWRHQAAGKRANERFRAKQVSLEKSQRNQLSTILGRKHAVGPEGPAVCRPPSHR